MERLQRVIAARGVSSRRSAEALITGGRVQVNGEPVTQLGTRVDPVADEIRVDGKVLRPQRLRTILLNKPAGYITTMQDERERRTVMDLVDSRERVFPVGRLDRDTEGLLLLTNDGELANRITHPRYRLAKEYHVLTSARPTDRTLQRLREGVRIDGRDVVPDEIRLLRETREGIWLRIVIHEGFYHAVRRIMEAANITVLRLRRHRIGPISLSGLESGQFRDLTPGELAQISEAVHLDQEAERPARTVETAREPADERTRSLPSSARRGRARLTSEPADGERDRPARPARGGEQRPDPTQQRPAARTKPGDRPPATRVRNPIVERPGAWSARRPVNPSQRAPLPGASARPVARPADRPSARPAASPSTVPVSSLDATGSVERSERSERPPGETRPESAGRFETVGGRRYSEVNRSFKSTGPTGASRPPARPGPRQPRRDATEGAGRPGPARPRAAGGRPASMDRTGARPAHRDERPRPAQDRPVRQPARQPSRQPLDAGRSGRPLETIGRVSRKVASANPDEAATRVKRRSPHPHSHRGRKPRPVAPALNTTTPKAGRTKQGKGNRRGRRR